MEGWETIQLAAGVHEASSIKYWDAKKEFILIKGGRKVRIEGEGIGTGNAELKRQPPAQERRTE